MKEQDSRTALRLPGKQRERIEKLVQEGKYKNSSQVFREALREFLDHTEGNNDASK